MFRTLKRDELANHPDFQNTQAAAALKQSPLGFIDVGARGGAHDMVEPLAGLTAVLGFEPDEKECARLMQNPEVTGPWKRIELEPIAIAEKAGNATLHLVSAATNHSLLPPNEPFVNRYNMQPKWTLVGTEELSTVTLDAVLFGEKRKNETFWGEFLKLDTQGTEYEILEGAKRTLLERTVAVVCEVAFCELYKGQKLFSEVELLMRGFGFSFYGFMPIHGRSKKQLDKREAVTVERALYTDAIFFKDPLPGGPKRVTLTPRQTHALFCVALLMNFYDFALELARETWLKGAPGAEHESVERLVKDLARLKPEDTVRALEEVMRQVQAMPERANICAGNFVDRRRRVCDYNDVLNVSPLPKTF
jgi:FkbM family methyltransferase